MSNFTKSILYSATVLAVGLVAIFSIYSNVSTSPDASVAAIEPATGDVSADSLIIPADPVAAAQEGQEIEGEATIPATAEEITPEAAAEATEEQAAEALPADSAIPAGNEEIAPVQQTIDSAAKEAEAEAETTEPSAGAEAVPALVPTEE